MVEKNEEENQIYYQSFDLYYRNCLRTRIDKWRVRFPE